MRSRLMFAQLGVAGLIIAVLGVWLAVVIAERDTQSVVADRLSENLGLLQTVRPAVDRGDANGAGRLLHEHEEQTGTAVVVFSTDGTPIAASRPDLLPLDAGEQARVRVALSGVASIPDGPAWPWDSRPLVLAAPFEDLDPGPSGAFLVVIPSEPIQRAVATSWSILAGCIVLSLLAVGAVTERATCWIAAPVRRLSDAVRALEPGQSLDGGLRRLNGRPGQRAGPPELQALAVELDEVAQRLRTASFRQSMFVSQASHQLRAPLTALRLRAEILGGAVDEEARAEHALVVEEIDRLASICDTLLTFARTRSVSPAGTNDLASLVEARIAAWAPVAGARGVTVRRRGVHSAWVRAADELVGQVVDVLIDNATRHAGTGAAIEIDLRTAAAAENSDPAEGYVDLHIIDNGRGMSAAELARAATPFAAGQRSGNGGTGLGLTIAAALVESAGGWLKLSRVQPQGLDAWIRLPAAGQAPVIGPRQGTDGRRRGGAAGPGHPRDEGRALSQ